MLPRTTTWTPDERERRRRQQLPSIRRESYAGGTYFNSQYRYDPRFRRYYYIHPQADRRVYMRSPHTNTLAARRGQTNAQFRQNIIGFRNANTWARDHIDSYL